MADADDATGRGAGHDHAAWSSLLPELITDAASAQVRGMAPLPPGSNGGSRRSGDAPGSKSLAATAAPAQPEPTHWHPGSGLLRVRVPNFAWRRRALARHDAHHLLTGFPHTPVGEMQLAAWEFAAGRYPHAGATAFCLPLVGLGVLVAPRRTFAAYLRGRRGATLYGVVLDDALLSTPLTGLRERFAPAADGRRARFTAVAAFAALAGLSLLQLLALASLPLVPALALHFVLSP